MHYIFLRNIIETTLENFVCQQCGKKITEDVIRVTSIAETGLGMTIVCPHCQTQAEIKAEIHQVANEMLKSEHGRAFFQDFLKKWGTFGVENTLSQKPVSSWIQPEDIAQAEQDILGASSIEDLLK